MAYVRCPHLPAKELEKDHSIYAIIYLYNGNEVKIWQPYVTDDDEQLEQDEIARNRIIRERLNPATDLFLCYMNGMRIGDDEPIEHGDRVLIGHRDEVDRDWWHRAMREMRERQDIKFTPPTHWSENEEEDPAHEEEVPEPAQPALCSPSSRLDQHEGKAQVDGGMETSEEESNARDKSGDSNIVVKDGTVAVDLRSQLSVLREPGYVPAPTIGCMSRGVVNVSARILQNRCQYCERPTQARKRP
jgi:hypothetical protein